MRSHVQADRRSLYSTTRWKRIRLVVLREARWRCHKCGRWANEVHHLDRSVEAFFVLQNLRSVCRACHVMEHKSKHSKTPGRDAWRERVRALAEQS